MISIIIPFKDRVDLLRNCINSILSKSLYQNYEIILVNNESKELKTLKYLDNIGINNKIRIIEYQKPFDFSAINNFAAKYANGEYLLFLNNDTEVISENWLEDMLECFNDKKVGAVGAKLLYPNGTIQHVGVMLEEKRLAVHAFRTWNEDDIKFDEPHEWSAVTAACMMTKKDLFLELGGFDELNLPIAYNDVDYCLRLRENGYKILCTPKTRLYHFESVSRKSDIAARFLNRKRYRDFLKEKEYIRGKWKKEIVNDLFFNAEYIKKAH